MDRYLVKITVSGKLWSQLVDQAEACQMPLATWARMILLKHVNGEVQEDLQKLRPRNAAPHKATQAENKAIEDSADMTAFLDVATRSRFPSGQRRFWNIAGRTDELAHEAYEKDLRANFPDNIIKKTPHYDKYRRSQQD